MAHDARGIANWVLDAANEIGFDLSHLALQKVLYFAHAWTLAETGNGLIGQGFEAWKFGPVVRVVYDQFKGRDTPLGSERAETIDVETGEIVIASAELSDTESARLRSLVRYYGQFHAGRLVDLTHEANGPWDRIWKAAEEVSVPGMQIMDADIRRWFLMSASPARRI